MTIGFSTGLPSLDALIGGLRPGQLVCVAGRSQAGMTTSLLSITRSAVFDQGIPTLFVTMEDDETLTGQRLLAGLTSVDSIAMSRGDVTRAERACMAEARARTADAPLTFADRSVRSVADVTTKARRRCAHNPRRLICVDAPRFLNQSGTGWQDIGDEVAVELKGMARLLNCAVVVTSPLAYDLENPDAVPTLDALGVDGEPFLRHADQVVLLHRYGWEWGAPGVDLDLLVAKNRSGPTGKVSVVVQYQYAQLFDLAAGSVAA